MNDRIVSKNHLYCYDVQDRIWRQSTLTDKVFWRKRVCVLGESARRESDKVKEAEQLRKKEALTGSKEIQRYSTKYRTVRDSMRHSAFNKLNYFRGGQT